MLRVRAGDAPLAEALATRALERFTRLGDTRGRADVLGPCRHHAGGGRRGRGSLLDDALDIARAHSDPLLMAEVQRDRGLLLRDQGDALPRRPRGAGGSPPDALRPRGRHGRGGARRGDRAGDGVGWAESRDEATGFRRRVPPLDLRASSRTWGRSVGWRMGLGWTGPMLGEAPPPGGSYTRPTSPSSSRRGERLNGAPAVSPRSPLTSLPARDRPCGDASAKGDARGPAPRTLRRCGTRSIRQIRNTERGAFRAEGTPFFVIPIHPFSE